MSYGREHKYNELYGGDVITPEPAKPCETYNYRIDHVNCTKECCTSRVKPVNSRTCLRSCCNVTTQRTRCSSAFCPVCDTCSKCYCYCECFCYHACHVGCITDHNHNSCPPKEIVACQPVFKKVENTYDKYYCNPFYATSCRCGRDNCTGCSYAC